MTSVSYRLRISTKHPMTLELLSSWRITIETGKDLDEEGQELIMQLSPAYIKWREETLQEGKTEGKAEGKAEVAINLLKNGMSCEQVVQVTGLPMTLILQLAGTLEK
jgi:predicted transposase/invertase (TIGR01784 family)